MRGAVYQATPSRVYPYLPTALSSRYVCTVRVYVYVCVSTSCTYVHKVWVVVYVCVVVVVVVEGER